MLRLHLISPSSYSDFYNIVMMSMAVLTFVHTQSFSYEAKQTQAYLKIAGGAVLIFVIITLGMRPLNSVFVDMWAYYKNFMDYVRGQTPHGHDIFFRWFTWGCAQIMSSDWYFFLCIVIYAGARYLASKKLLGSYWFYGFLMFVGSFSFFNFGVNAIRNGLAASLFLIGLSRDKRIYQALWMFLAVSFHKSLLLPTLGFIAVQFYNDTKGYYAFWFLSIPLSLAFGSFWQPFFAQFLGGNRVGYLTDQTKQGIFSATGFRWDFLFYSAFGVFAGWYYIFKKKIRDKFYIQLYNIYLFANAFWILVIRANFSNRFAYLSWFIMALVIVYPWAKYKFIKNQHKRFGYVLLAYIGFTFLMQFVYYAYIK